jgi:ubiquinone/menaquinone biosynthesis C-methylase UbiE
LAPEDGTTAIPAARLGAQVGGVEIAQNLVEAGQRRVRDMGLSSIEPRQGDACDLAGVADHAYDLAATVFGAMFVARTVDVAKAMVRVTKPATRIVLGNLISRSSRSARTTRLRCQ